jgi:hypothetical protein
MADAKSSESDDFPYPQQRLSEARTIAQVYDEAGGTLPR